MFFKILNKSATKDRIIEILEKENVDLVEKNRSLDRQIKSLNFEKDKLMEISDALDKKITEELEKKFEPKFNTFLLGFQNSMVSTTSFDNFTSRAESSMSQAMEEIKELKKQATATDKVFILADAVEKLLSKLKEKKITKC